MADQIMTVKEVAAYLKVNDRTIHRMAMSGKIPAFRVGASWRFKSCEVDAWIESEHNAMQQPILNKNVS
jgi:excisionase family DNA binding protein